MSDNSLLEDIEDAPVEALLDPDGALRRNVVALHVRAAMAPSHNERMLYAAQAAAAEGRLSRMFAEACLKNLVSIRRALYAYVDERIDGEEARLPKLMAELYALLEAHNTAAEQRLAAGDYQTRHERNRLCAGALDET